MNSLTRSESLGPAGGGRVNLRRARNCSRLTRTLMRAESSPRVLRGFEVWRGMIEPFLMMLQKPIYKRARVVGGRACGDVFFECSKGESNLIGESALAHWDSFSGW
jgi:hypothetical protein